MICREMSGLPGHLVETPVKPNYLSQQVAGHLGFMSVKNELLVDSVTDSVTKEQCDQRTARTGWTGCKTV